MSAVVNGGIFFMLGGGGRCIGGGGGGDGFNCLLGRGRGRGEGGGRCWWGGEAQKEGRCRWKLGGRALPW